MPAPTIYYIRHGETQWNADGKLQGQQDIPLNDLGRTQAVHAGNILAGLFARDGRAEQSLAFVASPLGRARSTMELVRGALKLPLADYAVDDRLREIGYGLWEGSTLAQMQQADPDGSPRANATNGRCRRRTAKAMSRCSFGCATGTISLTRTPWRWPMAAPRGR
jgi:broad specificity phosphatase PhoE